MKEANIVYRFLRPVAATLPFVPQATGQWTVAGDWESMERAHLVVDHRAVAVERGVGSRILVLVKNPTFLRHRGTLRPYLHSVLIVR
jgi:hypothetical protein